MNPRDQFDLYPRLSEAVRELATSSKPMKERLSNIWVSYLSPIVPFDKPRNKAEEKLMEAHQLITRCDAEIPGEGKIHATLRKTRGPTHEKIAALIFEAYEALVVPAFRGEK